jgi:hypothetical protein
MDCEKITEIYKRSCTTLLDNYSKNLYFEETYYKNDIQTKVDSNCLKSMQILQTSCNKNTNN